jgi:hypothetical protein
MGCNGSSEVGTLDDSETTTTGRRVNGEYVTTNSEDWKKPKGTTVKPPLLTSNVSPENLDYVIRKAEEEDQKTKGNI